MAKPEIFEWGDTECIFPYKLLIYYSPFEIKIFYIEKNSWILKYSVRDTYSLIPLVLKISTVYCGWNTLL